MEGTSARVWGGKGNCHNWLQFSCGGPPCSSCFRFCWSVESKTDRISIYVWRRKAEDSMSSLVIGSHLTFLKCYSSRARVQSYQKLSNSIQAQQNLFHS